MGERRAGLHDTVFDGATNSGGSPSETQVRRVVNHPPAGLLSGWVGIARVCDLAQK